MADYIDREGLLQIESLLKTDIIENNKVAIWLYEQIMHDIEAYPSEDVAPVIHARWVDWGVRDDNGNGEYTCSYCDHIDEHPPGRRIPYCWYCGAKMDMNKEGK